MRQGRYVMFVAVCALAVLIGGCGKDDDHGQAGPVAEQGGSTAPAPAQPQASAQAPAGAGGVPSATDLSNMAAKNREMLTQMNQGKQVTPVTADSLKAMLPEKLAGMTRTGADAEHNQAMGINITTSEGQYEGQNDASISLEITDIGNMTGPMRTGMTAWAMADIDRKTDSGYEKTGTYNGHKGMEEYDNQSKSGSLRIIVGDRFVVTLEGSNVTMDTLKQALGQIDLKKMASMASGS